MGLKRRVLLAGEEALGRSGAAESRKRAGRTDAAVVLLYHSTPDAEREAFIDPANALSPQRFERQMRFLAERRNVVPLRAISDALASGDAPPPGAVAITFDDGYADNLTVAGPICAELDLPVSLFIPSGIIERRESQWIDRLYQAAARATCHDVIIDGVRYPFGSRSARRRAYAEMSKQLLEAPTRTARDVLLDEFVRRLAPREADAPKLMMNWDDLRSWLALSDRFDVGSHTADHLDLTSTSRDETRRQLCESRDVLERELDRDVPLFSFPYGRADATSAMLAREAGYTGGVADGDDPVARPGADPMRVPRVVAPSATGRFSLITSGAWPALCKRVFGRASA